MTDAPVAVLGVGVAADGVRLHRPSRAVDPGARWLPTLVRRLVATARQRDAMGIAAVQIGLPVAVVVVRRFDRGLEGRYQALIDPMIVARSSDRISAWEYCLSVPYGVRRTLRSATIRVNYRRMGGEAVSERIGGDTALVLQHEIDHLRGRLLSDGVPIRLFIPRSRFLPFASPLFAACYERALDTPTCHALIESAWLGRESMLHAPR